MMNNSDTASIPREQVFAGIELAKAALEEIKTSIRSLHDCLQFGSAAVEREEFNLKNSGSDPFFYSRIPCAEAEIISCLRTNAARLYNASAHTIRYTPETDELPGKESLRGGLVAVHLEPDGIFIRLPMLGSRFARLKKLKLDQSHASIFRGETVYAIEHNRRFPSYDFSRFSDKIIQFLFVYNLEKGSCTHRIIDNDNHDTKAIQDAIVLYLPGGDFGLTCANYSASVLSQEVPEGTYITVTETKNGVMPASEIIRKWVALLAESETSQKNLT